MESFIAGRYTNSYSSVDVGITDNGMELQQDSAWENIDTSDAYGQSLLDGVYRGGGMHLQFLCKAYAKGLAPFWPWGSLGVMATAAAPIGRLASNVAAATVLAAVAGTPAAATPATVTASYSILAPNNPATLLFTSKLRQVPVRLAILPYDSGGGTIKWITTT